ncbi:hypothetical protein [Burkholderia multivorans]|uniref:hypothetical protein n=1 Tax=Burkholderia multivorans TaxID=87883 RepID=UPI0015E307C2|nr:hypothetical protein [Burkholderia multivorans]MCL4627706.1 hypothetical protein [Burkholderia multivorans]MCO1390796.1 hypothetical protein [Burkholderia multivorans]MDN7431638.1 hypothetical protein [Burkholderia multivorans]UQO13076.1 hypothetical protein L0Z40_21310 [Burkholderia multivorans]UQO55299.1 hypothetical protein L0Z30_05370 [Burkholderia multivorans]
MLILTFGRRAGGLSLGVAGDSGRASGAPAMNAPIAALSRAAGFLVMDISTPI